MLKKILYLNFYLVVFLDLLDDKPTHFFHSSCPVKGFEPTLTVTISSLCLMCVNVTYKNYQRLSIRGFTAVLRSHTHTHTMYILGVCSPGVICQAFFCWLEFHTVFVAFDHKTVKWRTGSGWELKLWHFNKCQLIFNWQLNSCRLCKSAMVFLLTLLNDKSAIIIIVLEIKLNIQVRHFSQLTEFDANLFVSYL